MRQPWQRTASRLVIVLALACGDSSNDPTPSPRGDTLTYTLQGAPTELGGVSLRLVAPGMDTSTIAFRAGSAHLIRVGGDTLSVALFGAIGNVELLTVRVADASDTGAFTAAVIEVVSPDNNLVPIGSVSVATSQR